MSLQLNHHHQQIYQALKNTSRHNIPFQPTHTPLLNPCSTYKQKYQTPPSILHSEMLQHYQNEIVRNAIDRRRLQFRDFVAEKIKKQQLSKQMEAQHHNLQILGKIDRLKKQRLMLFSQRRSDKQNNKDCMTYGKTSDHQQRPITIEKYPNSGKKYTRDHSVQISREIDRIEVQDKTLFSQLRSKELSKQKQHKNVDIEMQKQKIIKNNQIVSQISHKIQNMQSYLADNNSKVAEQKHQQPLASIIKDNQNKEKRERLRILANPIDKYHIQDKNSIKIQDSFRRDQTINKYSSYLNKGQEDTISNTNCQVDKYNVKMSKQYEYNQKLAEKIRNRWNVESHKKVTLGMDDEGSISTLPKNNFALQSSELVKNRPNSKLQYLKNYANLGNLRSQQKRGVKKIQEYMTENKIRDQLLVRNQMFNQYVERGGIKGLHVQDRLLDSSIFNNNTTIDNNDIPKRESSKKFIEDIPTRSTFNKKSILKNKLQRKNSKEADGTNGSKRDNKNKSKNSARSGRSRSSKSRERELDDKDKRNHINRRNINKKTRSVSIVPQARKIKVVNDQNKKQKDQKDYYSDRHNQRNSNRSQILSSNKQTTHNSKKNTIIPAYQQSILHKNNQNISKNTIQKIQKRVRLSMTIFEDSQYRNIIHEKNHLGNTYALQKSLRQDLIQKLCHGAEDLIKCKKNRCKNHRSFVL